MMKKYLFLLIFSTFILPIDNFQKLKDNIQNSEVNLFNILEFNVPEDLGKAIQQRNLFTLDDNIKLVEKKFFESLRPLINALKKSNKENLKLSRDEYIHLLGITRDSLPLLCILADKFRKQYFLFVENTEYNENDLIKNYKDLSTDGSPAKNIFNGEWAIKFCEKSTLIKNTIEILTNRLKPSEESEEPAGKRIRL